MTLLTCKTCRVVIVPDGFEPEDLARAMEEHVRAYHEHRG